jgi:hypothetical protein
MTRFAMLISLFWMLPGCDENGQPPVQAAPESEFERVLPGCPNGFYKSCYDENHCGCCQNGTVLDCLTDDYCYCCSGTNCM